MTMMTNMTGILLNGFTNAINHCEQYANRALNDVKKSLNTYVKEKVRKGGVYKWCRHQESNPGPTDYKSVALPAELYRLD